MQNMYIKYSKNTIKTNMLIFFIEFNFIKKQSFGSSWEVHAPHDRECL